MNSFPIAVGNLYPAEGSNHSIITMAQPDQARLLKGERVAILRDTDLRAIMISDSTRPEVRTSDGFDYTFVSKGSWRQAVGFDARIQQMGCLGSLLGDGENCTGDVILLEHEPVGMPVPVCWHHANLMEREGFGEKALVKDGMANQIARRILKDAVGARCGVHPGEVNATTIAWFATMNGLLPETPRAILQKAGMHFPPTQRFVGNGYRDTDARYRMPPDEAVQGAFDKAVKKLTVDPETPNALMGIPKRKTFNSEKYLQWVRSLPCVVTNQEGVQAHHIIDTLGGKMGGKTHDLFVMPVSPEQHGLLHKDRARWEKRNGPQWYHVLRTIDKALALGVLQ